MLIRNGTIVDGTGKERFKGDVRIRKDKISEVGNLNPKNGERVIDARNQFVVPGFIDILNRSDIHFSIFKKYSLRNLIKQGITTIVGGGCGSSLAPFASGEAIRSIQKWEDISKINVNWSSTEEFLDEVEKHNLGINFSTLTGHATLRRGVVGDSFKELSEAEMKKVEYLAERSMEEGSFGLSTGLAYSHAKVASPEELSRLVRVVKRRNGIYATHLRDEGQDLSVSVNETIAITEAHDVSSHIFHFKAAGKESWGEFPRALEMIGHAQDHGTSITFDVYPYARTASVLYLLLPDWVSHGGKKEVLKKLRDERVREKVRYELENKQDVLANVVIAFSGIDRTFIGKKVYDIAKKQEVSIVDALLNIIIASEDRVIGFVPTLDEKNVQLGIESKFGFIASDGAGYRTIDKQEGVLVHPRSFGAFPRFFGHYIRDMGIMSWESAIAKATSGPAEKIGLKKRGRVARGYFADIILFDPKKMKDKATFEDPFQYSEGVTHVFVNGGLALRKGKFQRKKYGRVLRK